MPLILALKNETAIVVASDGQTDTPSQYGQFMSLSNGTVVLIAGNLAFVRQAVELALAKVTTSMSTAAVAQLIQASLVVGTVPHLSEMPGRTELIVAGFDTVHHRAEPGVYYLDSAQDFYLQVVDTPAIAAGATAKATELLGSYDLAGATVEQLRNVAKDCLTATKLRWPEAVSGSVKIGVLTDKGLQVPEGR
jgi:20S proteasome alpha/beta subunit